MRVAVANDHRSYEAKRRLLPVLKKLGHDVVDFGCEGSGAVDYPDYAAPAAPMYFNYRKTSIYAGSNEIQHNIMAKMILGL